MIRCLPIGGRSRLQSRIPVIRVVIRWGITMSQSLAVVASGTVRFLLFYCLVVSIGGSRDAPAMAQSEVATLDRLDPGRIPAAERFDSQPRELVAVLGSHRWRHWGEAISVAFRPDGEIIASGGNDCFVRLWDRDGYEQAALELPSKVGMINAVAFRPDGQVLLAGAEDGVIYAWDITGTVPTAMAPLRPTAPAAGNQPELLAGASSIDAIAFTSDGKLLACCIGRQSNARVVLWDATQWPPLELRNFPQAMGPFAFSPDGKTMVTQESSGNILVWDQSSGRPTHKTQGRLSQPRNQMLTMAFAPDGRSIVTCHGDSDSKPFVFPGEPDGDVILWDLTVDLPRPKAVFGAFKYDPMFWMTPSAVFSPDGRSLALSTRQNRVELWDVSIDPPKRRIELPGRVSQPGTLAFAPDGQMLASVGAGIVLWDLSKSSPHLLSKSDPSAGVVFMDPSGQRLATVEFGKEGDSMLTRVWDLTGSRPEPLGEGLPGEPLGFGADGKFLTMEYGELQAGDRKPKNLELVLQNLSRTLRRWDVHGTVPRDEGTISFPSFEEFVPGPFSVKQGVRTAGSSVMLGENREGEFGLLRLDSNRDATFCKLSVPSETELYPSAYSANGAVFAAGMGDYGNRRVTVWDVSGRVAMEKGAIQGSKVPTRIQGVLPNGDTFDGGPGEDRPFNVWGIELSPDGESIALADLAGPIQVWSVAEGEPELRTTLVGHTQDRVMGAVRSLAFSSDGARLVTVGGDRKLVVWDIASGKAIYVTHFPDGVSLAAGFAPDDRHIVTSNPDGTMYILRLPKQP